MTLTSPSQFTDIFSKHGLSRWSVTRLRRPISIDFYRQWLDQGMAGEMTYLEEHLEKKEHPQTLMPQAHSAFVVAVDYIPHPSPIELPLKSLKIARYAQGADYHHWLKERLVRVGQELKQLHPDHAFLAMTDSMPVLERDLAHRAGLGWFGKNTCLIDSTRGSFFLIGEIYTSLEFEDQNALPHDLCGKCSRCIDACPTGALKAPRRLDARLCISYWTIESRAAAPKDLRPHFDNWFFGCDICQEVCPWNEKIYKQQLFSLGPTSDASMEDDLRYILSTSNKQLERDLKGTALLRAGGRGLKKNALVLVGNLRLRSLTELVRKVGCDYAELSELAIWTLGQIESVES